MKQTVGFMTVVMNEEPRLPRCLDLVMPYVDEISIADQFSDDNTWAIIQEYQKKSPIPFYAFQDKRWGTQEASWQSVADKLTTDWILYLDADEELPVECLKNIRQIVDRNDVDGFTFPRDNIFDIQIFTNSVPLEPKWLSVRHPALDPQLRLSRKKYSFFPRLIHSRVRIYDDHDQQRIERSPYHMTHRKTLAKQWQVNELYTNIALNDQTFQSLKEHNLIICSPPYSGKEIFILTNKGKYPLRLFNGDDPSLIARKLPDNSCLFKTGVYTESHCTSVAVLPTEQEMELNIEANGISKATVFDAYKEFKEEAEKLTLAIYSSFDEALKEAGRI